MINRNYNKLDELRSQIFSNLYYFNIELEHASFNLDIILTGDFNIDIFSSQESYADEQLNDMMQLNNLTHIVKEHTRVTDISHTLIDYIYVSNISHVQEVRVLRMSISDHYAVCMNWKKQNINSDKGRSNNFLITYIDQKNFNYEPFINNLNRFMYVIDKEDSVDNSVDIMISNLHTILDKHAPWKHKRVRTKFSQCGLILI